MVCFEGGVIREHVFERAGVYTACCIELLYRAILLVWAWMMACDTEWKAVDKNLEEDVVSDCDRFIVARCVLRLVLRRFFSTLVGVLASVN